MRQLWDALRDRRGTVAVMFGLVAVPLIGASALGAEAGFWYVVKREAQNAADAAAYAGALRLAFPSDSKTVDYRGRQFAAQNGFCQAAWRSMSPRTASPSRAE